MGILKTLDNVGGIGGFISNGVVNAYYNGKGKFAITSRDLKASLTKKSREYDAEHDDESENKSSEHFAKVMGFGSAEECDEFFDQLEREEERAKKAAERKKKRENSCEIELTKEEFQDSLTELFSEIFSSYTDETIENMSPEEKQELLNELNHIPEAISAIALSMTAMIKNANDLTRKLQNQQIAEQTVAEPVPGMTAADIADNIAKVEAAQKVVTEQQPVVQPQIMPEGVQFIKPMQPISQEVAATV